ncbi:MAG: bifunctional metallophosphatase/5'-nucleotidase [Clostridia bacterium]|nr:bifunctional metallophosphatase/5'-nucleotidase [Clostridia bacterium]
MKKLIGLLLCLALLLGCAGAEEAAAATLSKPLVVLFTSDVHCGIDSNWGYAGLVVAKEYFAKDNYVLLVDDGDALQGEPVGTMTHGEAIIDIMNEVGYDIAIPGNHDFDYSVQEFLKLAERAKYEYISCNFNKEGELVFKPYTIREFDGVKIGFVGVTTPDTLRSSTPTYFMNEAGEFVYGFFQDKTGEKLYEAVQKAVDGVRAEGAQYVILIAHLGNEDECIPWRYNDVISNTNGINVVFDGHSHDYDKVVMKNKDGENVIRQACGTKLDTIGALTIQPDGSMDTALLSWDRKTPAAPELFGLQNAGSEAVAKATEELNENLTKVVAKSSVDLVIYDPTAVTEDGKPIRIVRNAETNLGDLCADAYRDQAGGADIAWINGGGIRTELKAGDLTLGAILKVHPFGNSLTVIEVSGQQVLDALEWSVHSMPGEFGGFNQVSGITFELDCTIESPVIVDENGMFASVDASKERRVRNVLVGGEALDPAKTYTLASVDYQLLNKGDGYTMFDGCKVVQESVKLDNQVLIDFIQTTLGGVVGEGYDNPYGQGRIVSVGGDK